MLDQDLNYPQLAVSLGDYRLTYEVFERKAALFLNGSLEPALFLELCNLALDYAEQAGDDDLYKLEIHKYRFLAKIGLQLYYEATADAYAVLNEYHDVFLYYEMMCSLSLKRSNHYSALDYLEKMMDFANLNGLDSSEFLLEHQQLTRFISKILHYHVEDLCRAVLADGDLAQRSFAGLPLLVTGKARFMIYPHNNNPYLLFSPEQSSIQSVYCHAPVSELPYLRHVRPEQEVTVFGYLLKCDQSKIVLKPCNILDSPFWDHSPDVTQ